MRSAFSLTQGGPYYQFLQRLRVVRSDAHDGLRQSAAFIALGWLPLQVFSWVDGVRDGAPGSVFWHALALHARFLLATPLLIYSELLLESRCRGALASLDTDEFGRGTSRRLAIYARAAERLRDSLPAELALLTLMVAVRFGIWQATGQAALVRDYNAVGGSPIAAVWHGFVSLPLFNFLILRWLWRWCIWAWLLWRVARLRLQLVPSHPDGAAGLARLAEPSYAVATMLGGLCTVLACSWGSDIVYAKTELSAYLVHFVVLVLAGEALALAPLLPFIPLLTRARFRGGDAYGRFALAYTRAFHARWIEGREREGLLGTPDISGLADLISSVDHVNRMRVTPFDQTHAIAVLVAIVLPMLPLPLLAADVSLLDFLERTLLSLVLGG